MDIHNPTRCLHSPHCAAGNDDPAGIWSNGDVMFVADENDGRVYAYNMPVAIDTRLASLTLGGVDIGEFSSDATEYEGTASAGLERTTVTRAQMATFLSQALKLLPTPA